MVMEKSEKKKKILIVEDDTFIRDIYQTKFNQESFEVIMAENGIIALEKIEQLVPDIILLDVVMPYMDGMEVLRLMKDNKVLENVPIVMLTNISEKEKIDEGMRIGASDYLIKSHFTPSEVVHKVKILLNI